MARRKVFYSFDFETDARRVQQVKQMGVLAGQQLLTSNQWESVKKGGDRAIRKWIDEQMAGKTCLVVLIGRWTSGRRWVDYEIEKAWNDGRGVVGVHIHNLKDLTGRQTTKGANPLRHFTVGQRGVLMSSVAKTYDPPYTRSTSVYAHIEQNLPTWVEEAIAIRAAWKG